MYLVSQLASRRHALALALLTGLSLSVTSLNAASTDKRTLHVVSPWEIGSLDPSKTGYIFSKLEVTETLVTVDNQGILVPGLATAWVVSGNQLTWRFTLRPGATFHDGTLVTASDVVAALERARKNPGVLGNVPLLKISAEPGVVIFELSKPFTPLGAFLAQYSAQILAPSAFTAEGTVKAVIGTGPYRVVSLQAPLKLVAERFAGWHGKPPSVERVSYLAVSRGETRHLLATSGQADLVFTHDPANFNTLKTHKSLKFYSQPVPRTIYIKVNAGHSALKDQTTRRALSLAIDRAGIASAVLREPQAAATQLFPPSMAQWHVNALQPLTRDLAQSRELLKSAGWILGTDNVLRRDGKPFKVTLRTYSDRPELPLIAAALQAQFKEIGIDLAVVIANSSEVPAGHKDGTLELALVARNYSLVPDPVGTLMQDFGATGGDWGAMNWRSAALQDAVNALSATNDTQRRSVQRGAIATIIQADLPVIPVAWYQHTATSSNRLAHVSVDPLEISYRITQMKWAK